MDSPQLPWRHPAIAPRQVDRFAKTAAVTEANLIRLERRKWVDVWSDAETLEMIYHMGRRSFF